MIRHLRHRCGHRVDQLLDAPGSAYAFRNADPPSDAPITNCPFCGADLVRDYFDGHLSELAPERPQPGQLSLV